MLCNYVVRNCGVDPRDVLLLDVIDIDGNAHLVARVEDLVFTTSSSRDYGGQFHLAHVCDRCSAPIVLYDRNIDCLAALGDALGHLEEVVAKHVCADIWRQREEEKEAAAAAAAPAAAPTPRRATPAEQLLAAVERVVGEAVDTHLEACHQQEG